ncbi:NAD(P)-binding protein [Calocera viscosa TUFC12733]|uniref:NAD(P)-binding protein n=1 Tax=Calocera viscosa (strain TUFC12733) TaxID=1330018 RepID=A0A167KKY5_CALVF|nr:NAD(P)-binding protein [Calocera viscosa TUFC12733]
MQGGAVIDALVKHGGYLIRGLSRNVEAEAAKHFVSKGVEMITGHLLDKESLIKAFAGAYAVFGVSIPFQPEGETVQGQNLVDACKANDVPLLVWSSLPSASALSNGKYRGVLGFDQKSEVDKYVRSSNQPAVILHTGTFAENILDYGYLKEDPDKPDNWHIYTPIIGGDVHWPVTYPTVDLGPCVLAILESWENDALRAELSKDSIVVVQHTISGNEMAETIQQVTGKLCDYVTLPVEMTPAPFIQPYSWGNDGFFTYGDKINPQILVKIGVKLHTFEDYVNDKVVPFMKK